MGIPKEQLSFGFPASEKMMALIVYATLYRHDVAGSVREWFMEQDGDKYRSQSRLAGGKWNVSGWHLAYPKNVGKKNCTSAEEQALAEIEAKYQKKRDQGFSHDPTDIGKLCFTEPMLARKWSDLKDSTDIDQCYIQPKLDGIRCIARADGLWTRKGKRITSCSHIEEGLVEIFQMFPDLILDGELYNHEYKDKFDELSGAIRTKEPDMFQQIEIRNIVEYHIYDLVQTTDFDEANNFSRRYSFISDILSPISPVIKSRSIKKVATYLAEDEENMERFFAKWLEEGYEGQMIRVDLLESSYECGKRSRNLIKNKEFETDEFPILDMKEGLGNWSGCVKEVVLDISEKSPTGVLTCDSGIRGKQPVLWNLWHSIQVTGIYPDWATVRYQGWTAKGRLRFPVVVDYGYGVRED